jgi:hypothetical protein
MKPNNAHPPPTTIEKRLRRIESRLVQLMIHMGLNPYSKQYDGDEVPPEREKEKSDPQPGK